MHVHKILRIITCSSIAINVLMSNNIFLNPTGCKPYFKINCEINQTIFMMHTYDAYIYVHTPQMHKTRNKGA